MRNGIIKIWLVMLAAATLLIPAAASAQVPQTIVIDGVNDFNVANLVDADGGDVEAGNDPLDLGDCYVTNDAVSLYFGCEQDKGVWTTIQIGIAVDVNTAAGGTVDPWGRKIEWSLSGTLPDFIMYVNLDNGWQDLRVWNTVTEVWDSAVSGTNALGWNTGTGFKELSVLLSTFDVTAADPINVEFWTTQDGDKGPLDAASNDASQLSTPSGTTWVPGFDVPMFTYLPYTIQAAADPNPPLVSGAQHLLDSQVNVSFNEPVDQTTAEVAGNYSVSGATVTGAARDGANLNVVHLTLAADIGPSASMYTVTVTDVEDLAGNPITENGSDNVGCFALKNVLFRGRMGPFLGGQTEPYGGFTVEGGPSPLTWGLCDGMDGVDVGGDIYEVDADFCIPGNCGAGTAQANIEWKWVYDCATYEPLASNRQHLMDLATGANDVIDVWWNDQDPTQFTAHDIDVFFYVDASLLGLAAGDSISINGERLPLNWHIPPELQMDDDGTGIDDTSGDEIYSLLVTFPAGTEKNVNYKFVHNSDYECLTQGDRNVFLNDELFDTDGGALGPLILPVVHFDACDVLWRGVEVVFSVDVNDQAWPVGGADVVTINGTPSNSETPSFSWDVPSLNQLLDDGVSPDAASGDGIYTVSIVFADSSQIHTNYKYLVNDVYECADQGNRYVALDADNYDDLGNPQVLPLDNLHQCNTTGVDDATPARMALDQNHPNPFNPMTEIRFTVHRAGSGSLQVFNMKGELVRTLIQGRMATGPHAVTWDGADDTGRQSPTGVYFYRLDLNGEVDVRKMMLVK